MQFECGISRALHLRSDVRTESVGRLFVPGICLGGFPRTRISVLLRVFVECDAAPSVRAIAVYRFNAGEATPPRTVPDAEMRMFEFVHNRPLLPGAISVEFWDVRLSDKDTLRDYGIPRGTQLDVSFAKFHCFAVTDPKGASCTSQVGDKG
jgi:hypothetical protein